MRDPCNPVARRAAQLARQLARQLDPPFCGVTPDGATWPVCALGPHQDGEHESADYHWADDGPAILKEQG